MKTVVNCLFFCVSIASFAQDLPNQETPKECVSSFFQLFHHKDTAGMKVLVHEDILVSTVQSNQADTILHKDNAAALFLSLASIPDSILFEERILSMEVKKEGLIAQVWTPYEFYVNGQLSHRGVNAFTLLNTGGRWCIIHLIDTRRR